MENAHLPAAYRDQLEARYPAWVPGDPRRAVQGPAERALVFPHADDHDPYGHSLDPLEPSLSNPLVKTGSGEASTAFVVGSMALDVENSLAALGAVAPRIDLKDLHEKVASCQFMRPGMVLDPHNPSELDRLTLALVTMQNGFVIVGKSSCAHIDNYAFDKGCRFAVDDAMRQLWTLEGYLLRENMYCEAQVDLALAASAAYVDKAGIERIVADLQSGETAS